MNRMMKEFTAAERYYSSNSGYNIVIGERSKPTQIIVFGGIFIGQCSEILG